MTFPIATGGHGSDLIAYPVDPREGHLIWGLLITGIEHVSIGGCDHAGVPVETCHSKFCVFCVQKSRATYIKEDVA